MTETAVPDDLMKVARGCFCAKEIGTPSSMPLTLARLERALEAERERATLAERARCAEIADVLGDEQDVTALQCTTDTAIRLARARESQSLRIAKIIRLARP